MRPPANSTLDATAIERTAATARTLGLSQPQAQQLLESVHAEVATQVDAATAKARADALAAHQPGGSEWTEMRDQWQKDALEDPALGKTPEERTLAIQKGHAVFNKYAEQHPAEKEGFTHFLNASGLGDHPAVVRFFHWLGIAMGEGSAVMQPPGAPSKAPEDTAAKWYGEDGKGAKK